MTLEGSRNDIVSIQMLRGVAALMVVLVHVNVQLSRLEYERFGADWLTTGVDIFFVISGFIMWTSVSRNPNMTALEFLRNRAIRVVPLYWVVTLFILIALLIFPRLFHTTVFDSTHALASFLFVPTRHPVTHEFWPLLVPGWTLNLEMFFYLAFSVSIFFGRQSARSRLVVILVMISGSVLIANLLETSFDIMNFYANPMMLEFLAGILIAVLYCRKGAVVSWLWLICAVVGFLLLWHGGIFGLARPLVNLAAATMIVAGSVFAPRMSVPGLRILGDVSYSLYLTHVISLAAIGKLWSMGLRDLGAPAFVFTAVSASVLGAFTCYHVLERPLTAFFKSRSVMRSRNVLAA